MGLNSSTWGRQAWHFIHAVALSYPQEPTEEDKENYKRFFYSLSDVLPCAICGINFAEKLETSPPNLESQDSLWKWTVDVHNQVNKKNNKPTLTYDEAYSEFVKNSNSNSNSNSKLIANKEKYSPILEISFAILVSILGIKLLNY